MRPTTHDPRPKANRSKVKQTESIRAFNPTDIFAALNVAKIQYLVVGGLAVVLYGISRTTYDVDLAVHLTTDNLERLAKALKQLGLDRKSTRLNSSHSAKSRMPSSA